MGSNQSTEPDVDRAAAICWEICPLIGLIEKGHRSTLRLALDRFTSRLAAKMAKGLQTAQRQPVVNMKISVVNRINYFTALEECVFILERHFLINRPFTVN